MYCLNVSARELADVFRSKIEAWVSYGVSEANAIDAIAIGYGVDRTWVTDMLAGLYRPIVREAS
jgi:hypothetical protein